MMINFLHLQGPKFVLNVIEKNKKFKIYRMMTLEPLIKDLKFKNK